MPPADPDVGVAESQLPPVVVVEATVQLVAADPDGIVNVSVCAAGLTPSVEENASDAGDTLGPGAVTLNCTGVCGGFAPFTVTYPKYVPTASPVAFTDTESDVPEPDVGETLSQFAPSYVKTEAVQLAFTDPVLASVSCNVCGAGFVPPAPV